MRAVPALLAVVGRRERVVVGQQQEVEAVGLRGRRDLRHRAGAVRVGRVQWITPARSCAGGGSVIRRQGIPGAIGTDVLAVTGG